MFMDWPYRDWENEGGSVSYTTYNNIPSDFTRVKGLVRDLVYVNEITFKAKDITDALKIVNEAKEKLEIQHVPSEIKKVAHQLFRVRLLVDEYDEAMYNDISVIDD